MSHEARSHQGEAALPPAADEGTVSPHELRARAAWAASLDDELESYLERSRWRGMSLRVVLLAGLLVVVLATLLLVSLSVLGLLRSTAEAELQRSAKVLAETAARSGDDGVLERWYADGVVTAWGHCVGPWGEGELDAAIAQRLCSELEHEELTSSTETGASERMLVAAAKDGERAVVVAMTMRPLDAQVRRAQAFVVGSLVVVGAIVLLFGSWFLGRNVVKPIRRLLEASERVASGKLDARISTGGLGEVARLSEQFNRMVSSVRRARKQLEDSLDELGRAHAELARKHAALEQAQQSLVRSERLATVGQLAAGVAHEIGNPLSSILAYLAILEEPDLEPEEAHRILLQLRDATLRIQRTIRELLDYSRSSAGVLEALSPAGAVQQVLNLVRPQPRLRGVEIHNELPAELPAALVDESKLVQVLLNLVLNAGDAMRGSARRELHLGARVDATHVHLTVRDTGPGIPAELEAKIFEPFFTTKDPGEGTGLGLAICERLAEQMQARLVLENGSEGCTFRIELARA